MKVAVLDDWQGIAHDAVDWSPLQERAELVFFREPVASEDDAVHRLAEFGIVLSMRERTPLAGSLIRRLPELRMLGITGAHNASLDLQACIDAGITVCNTVATGVSQAGTAELALGLLLSAARSIPAADRSIREGRFQEGLPFGLRLEGKTIGILGLGRLGSLMARYCLALNMKVIAWSPNLTPERAEKSGARFVTKAELCSASDVISIHMVLSERSRGLIGAREFASMRSGTILINTSRGPIVEERAMLEALSGGRIIAALDVFDSEPLPAEHPLRTLPNTVLTPHLGYVVRESMTEFYRQSRDNAVAFLDRRPIRVISHSG